MFPSQPSALDATVHSELNTIQIPRSSWRNELPSVPSPGTQPARNRNATPESNLSSCSSLAGYRNSAGTETTPGCKNNQRSQSQQVEVSFLLFNALARSLAAPPCLTAQSLKVMFCSRRISKQLWCHWGHPPRRSASNPEKVPFRVCLQKLPQALELPHRSLCSEWAMPTARAVDLCSEFYNNAHLRWTSTIPQLRGTRVMDWAKNWVNIISYYTFCYLF